MAWPAAFIIIIEFCEQIGFYTFQGTQKAWLQNQGYSNASSSSMNQVFGLLSFITAFFGGWLAETRMGRYRTIMSLVAVYVVGCFLAAIAVHPSIDSFPLYMIGTFVLVAIGTGGIKPNVSTFGADQIDPADPNVERTRGSFFLYCYLAINVGCLIPFGFLCNVATNGLPPLVSSEDGFFFAYMVASGAMALAWLVFMAGTPFYRKESFLTQCEPVLALSWRRLLSGRSQRMGKVALVGWALIPAMIVLSIVQAVVPSTALTVVSAVVDVVCFGCLCVAHRDNSWLGEADSVTRCLDCVPVVVVANITFGVMYNTMASVFFSEACQMDLRLGSGTSAAQFNGSFFNLADAVAIIVFTPVVDRLIVPSVERILQRPVSITSKLYVGIAFAMGSQLVAAALESARLGAAVLPIPSKCAPLLPNGEHAPMSDLSAFWMSVPYAMIGIGEILVCPVLMHFVYERADPSMRSLMQAFNMFAVGGMPNAISATLTQATASLTPNNLNDGNLPLVYLINVAFGLCGCFLLYCVSHGRLEAKVVDELEPAEQKEAAAL